MIIDIRTIVLLSVITCFICTLLIVLLWRQNRSRYSGLGFLVLDFAFQTIALTLIVLRGVIPDWISIIISNFMVVSGSIAGYIGLLRFIDRKNIQILNYILLAVFTAVHVYFTYGNASLEYRNLNLSVALLVICFQCSRLLLYRVTPEIKHLTFWAGIIFAGYCLVSTARIAEFFFHVNYENDLFHSGLFQGIIQIIFISLFLLLTYSFVIMVNGRLLMEITAQEEKFSKAFHTAPYAITLTRMADGKIFDINESFTTITGFDRTEVIGKKTMDLHIFSKDDDRNAVVESLTKNGRVQGIDLGFRKKNGDSIIGHLNAEIIIVNGEINIMASIADITERKLAEDRIKKLLDEKELILKEVHHRIKNNMNTINGLLNLQAGRMVEPAAVAALEDAGNRVQSMMVLYDKLYQSDNINEAAAGTYLPDLVEQIVLNFPNSRSVKIETNIDDFVLEVKHLSPLGIIINELVTNIMKYAFKGRESGIITVSAMLKNNFVTLVIQDNGIGIPESVSLEKSTGFGFSLVNMLTDQLNGTIRLERGNGTRFVLEFEV